MRCSSLPLIGAQDDLNAKVLTIASTVTRRFELLRSARCSHTTSHRRGNGKNDANGR